ncbi:SDR family oxidoreductase [Rhodanobacter sp. Col0626]|uniref:SDR family oxidoreductase n=1 Tax=Rhodanobacter sp. Col0626 TaxID=3415679 RepID=UPI003CEBACF1
MKIVVIGGTGLIGSKVVDRLRKHSHEVLAAAPSSGVNALTGEGLDRALAGADMVIDLANSPSFEDQAVLDFFETSGHNLLAAEKKAGVKHHLALSVVGTGRPALATSGYIRAKLAQENLIRASGIPYTIVHSTQFFEFLGGIAGTSAQGQETHLSTGLMQPIASDDVADAVADYALGAPVNGTVEIAGPEKAPLAELVQRFLTAIKDPRKVVADPQALYFGAVLEPGTLLPGNGARLGTQDFQTWFSRSAFAAGGAPK